MREGRDRSLERPEERDVLRRVREVIVSAQDVRDPHVGVVHADREVIERVPVGAHENEVVERVRGKLDPAADEVVDDDRLRRHLQTHDELLARSRAAVALVRRDLAAGPGVAVRASQRFRFFSFGLELLGSLERAVGLTPGEEPVGRGPVEVGATRLPVGALVVLETEPVER